MIKEVWKFIKETDNLYQVSNLGRIRSYHKVKYVNGYIWSSVILSNFHITFRKD